MKEYFAQEVVIDVTVNYIFFPFAFVIFRTKYSTSLEAVHIHVLLKENVARLFLLWINFLE